MVFLENSPDNREAEDRGRYEPSPDVSFEEGVEQAMARIEQLLDEKDIVIVAIEGACPNSGKSYLEGALQRRCSSKNGVCVRRSLDDDYYSIRDAMHAISYTGCKKGVIIVKSAGFECSMPPICKKRYLENLRKSEIEVDLLISIYAPVEPFLITGGSLSDVWPIGDIVIRNDAAKVKYEIFKTLKARD